MAMEIWTIKKLLEWISEYFETNGVDSPRLSAELLLCHVLKLERIQLYTLYDRVVQADQLAALRALVKRGAEHEPIAYLVGRCEFYSLPLKITPDCLIPRPETEDRTLGLGSIVEFELSEQQQMIQAGSRDFAARVVRSSAVEIDKNNRFPVEIVREMAALGYKGLPFPAAYGGGGTGYLSAALALEQISQASATVASIMAVNNTPQEALSLYASEEQAQEVARSCTRWEMRYEEMLGSDEYVRRLAGLVARAGQEGLAALAGIDGDFVVIPPGGQIQQEQFMR